MKHLKNVPKIAYDIKAVNSSSLTAPFFILEVKKLVMI